MKINDDITRLVNKLNVTNDDVRTANNYALGYVIARAIMSVDKDLSVPNSVLKKMVNTIVYNINEYAIIDISKLTSVTHNVLRKHYDRWDGIDTVSMATSEYDFFGITKYYPIDDIVIIKNNIAVIRELVRMLNISNVYYSMTEVVKSIYTPLNKDTTDEPDTA